MNTTLSASLVDQPVFENAVDSYTMPARLYTDPDVFEQEKRRYLRNRGITLGTKATSATLAIT